MAYEVVVLSSDSEDEATQQVRNGKNKTGPDLKGDIVNVESENDDKVGDGKKSENGHKEIAVSNDAAKITNGDKSSGTLEEDDDIQFIEEPIAGPSGSQPGSQASDDKSEGDLIEVEEESADRLAVKSALENFFLNSGGKRGMTPLRRKKLGAEYLTALGDVDMTQENVKDQLLVLISAAEEKMREKKKVPWAALLELKKLMLRNVKNNEKIEETEDERKERVAEWEELLAKHGKVIADREAEEVDLDDETNSAYLVIARLKKRYMTVYNKICRATGSNCHTGRPIEKSIRLPDDITRFPEVKTAVEKFINSKNCLFVPDFCDIKNVVEIVNKNSQPQLFAEEDAHNIAQDLFKAALCKIKKRRASDLKEALALAELYKVTTNPEVDPELERKLQENDKQRKNEHDVIEKFVKRQQELQAEAQDVLEEDADQSAPESDDDLDSEDEGAENADHPDNIDPAAESCEEYRGDLVDPEDDISDDDDEVGPVISHSPPLDDPPPKRQKVDDSS